MTSIVGIVHEGVTYLAADSLVVTVPDEFHSEVSQTVRKEPKIFKKNGMLFGYSGSVRMGQLLRYDFRFPEYTLGREKMDYLVVDFVTALKKRLKEAEFDREGLGGNILIGWDGEFFTINSQWAICNTADNYDSIGKSSEVAIGSLHTTGVLGLPPLQRMKLALLATERHTCVVSAPFLYITSEMHQAETIPSEGE